MPTQENQPFWCPLLHILDGWCTRTKRTKTNVPCNISMNNYTSEQRHFSVSIHIMHQYVYRNLTGMSALTGEHQSSAGIWDGPKLSRCDADDVVGCKVLAWDLNKRYYFTRVSCWCKHQPRIGRSWYSYEFSRPLLKLDPRLQLYPAVSGPLSPVAVLYSLIKSVWGFLCSLGRNRAPGHSFDLSDQSPRIKRKQCSSQLFAPFPSLICIDIVQQETCEISGLLFLFSQLG